MNEMFIDAGLILAGFALRTFEQSWFRRLGGALVIYATYRLGVSWFDSIWAGCLMASLWILLPALQVLVMAKSFAMPLEKRWRPRNAPSSEEFPELSMLTEEFESEGFVQTDDVGWDWQDMSQFSRIFYHAEHRLQGAIQLNSQRGMVICYVVLTTRSNDGAQFCSSNYPLGAGLKFPPNYVLNRCDNARSIGELIESHQAFIAPRIKDSEILEPEVDEIVQLSQNESRQQIDHNLDHGLIRLSGEGQIAYSWRGCIFIVRQFMIDLFRLS